MDCIYINLAADIDKRKDIESLFSAYGPSHWVLQRFEAIDKNYVQANSIKGNISDGAKGCFLSHKSLLHQNLGNNNPLLILEDDVVFTSQTFAVIDEILQQLAHNQSWDIIHTDICIPSPGAMIDFYMAKKDTPPNKINLINLQDKFYASTAGYLINSKSIEKIFNLLNSAECIDQPIDLFYRTLTHAGVINSYVTLPFITSLSSKSKQTNIQTNEHAYTELVWHTYRKFIWLSPDQNLVQDEILKIEKSEISKEDENLMRIVSGAFRAGYQEK